MCYQSVEGVFLRDAHVITGVLVHVIIGSKPQLSHAHGAMKPVIPQDYRRRYHHGNARRFLIISRRIRPVARLGNGANSFLK